MPTYTVSGLITKTRTKADMNLSPAGDNNAVVTDTEVLEFINEAFEELWDIVTSVDEDHFITSSDITTSGVATYDLPADFMRLKGVDFVHSSTYSQTLLPVSWNQRNQNSYIPYNDLVGDDYRYHLIGTYTGQQIKFFPTPSTGETIRVWYVPEPPTLATGSGVTSIALKPMWMDYLTSKAAIECLVKEESDSSRLQGKVARLEEKIKSQAMKRDYTIPETMDDASIWNQSWKEWGDA